MFRAKFIAVDYFARMLRVAFWGFFWTFAGVLLDSLTTIKQSYDYTTSKQLPFKKEKNRETRYREKAENPASLFPDSRGC